MDSVQWNKRYATSELVWTAEPNRFLPPEVEGLLAGKALDLACGEGRNAVWLAAQGWQTTGVDFSDKGLEKAAGLARARSVDAETTWVSADVTSWQPDGPYDLVIVFYLQLPEPQRRAAMGVAARALGPGGTLVVVGHDTDNLVRGVGGPPDPSVLFSPDDLARDLASSGVADLVIERATQVERPVTTLGEAGETVERVAIDCLVRASRPPTGRTAGQP